AVLSTWRQTSSTAFAEAPAGKMGDVNGNGTVTVLDAITLINFVFGGPPLSCPAAGDLDNDHKITIHDAIVLLNLIFQGNTTWTPLTSCSLSSGAFKWQANIGGLSPLDTASVSASVTDANDNIIVVGGFSGTVNIGG